MLEYNYSIYWCRMKFPNVQKENCYAINNYRVSERSGEKHPGAKLTQVDVDLIRELLESKLATVSEIMEKFKISRSTVSSIKNYETWKVKKDNYE